MAGRATWIPHLYAALSMFFVPLGIIMAIPDTYVHEVYIFSSMAYMFISVWIFIQTCAAWWMGTRQKHSRNVRICACRPSLPPWCGSLGSSLTACCAKVVPKTLTDDVPTHERAEAGVLLPSGAPSVTSVADTKIVYVVPAFLDNEADILDETLASYCKLKFSGHLYVIVVYNSRGDMGKAEAALETKWDGLLTGQAQNIFVRVVKNYESTSKAENVNLAVNSFVPSDADYIAIMDADHHPWSDSASIAARLMQTEGYDILQGACTIRNQDNFLSTMISVEFEHIYCVAHYGRFLVFDLGLFVGSNGYWKSSVLKEIEMEKSMLTEDIDSSIRASLAGYKIGYCADIVSSELAPVGLPVLKKQRLRWAQGWAEVSFKHAGRCFVSNELSWRQKLGVIHLFVIREIFPYAAFWPMFCVVAALLWGDFVFSVLWATLGGAVLVLGLTRVAAAYALSRGPIGASVGAYAWFAVWGLYYDIYLNYLQVVAHGRSLHKTDTWVATVRQ